MHIVEHNDVQLNGEIDLEHSRIAQQTTQHIALREVDLADLSFQG